MKNWKKIIILTFIIYLILLILWMFFVLNDYKKLYIIVAIIFLGYSIFNIGFSLLSIYKFIKNKIHGKDGNENINKKSFVKKTNNVTIKKRHFSGCLTGCLLTPIIILAGWFLLVSFSFIIMAIHGQISGYLFSKNCSEIVSFKDPTPTEYNPTLGKKEEKVYVIYSVGGGYNRKCSIIKSADLGTFKPLGGGYAKDKNNVYSTGDYIDNGFKILDGVDVSTFEYVGDGYTKDKNNVYHYENSLPSADTTTFIPLGGGYAKDKKNVYYSENRLIGADVTSFEKVKGILQTVKDVRYDAKDRNNLYLSGKVVGANLNSNK